MKYLTPSGTVQWKEPGPALSVALLAALTLACLAPFLGKAVHMDDPLFLWTARQIRSHPLDFYGFLVDWDTRPLPMAVVMQNPPLAAYYMAAAGAVLGWSEGALHLAFLLPAVAAVLGTYFVARKFCSNPFAAALAMITTPVFLLSSTSLMCDTAMVALWVWAVFFWMEGLRDGRWPRLALAALLMAACGLAKYFGACVIPLLLVYALTQQRRPGRWLPFLCFPVAVLAGYQWMTHRHYGQGLLLHAAAYAAQVRLGNGLAAKTLTALAFGGGCVFIGLAATPLLWGKRGLCVAAAGGVGAALWGVAMQKVGVFAVVSAGQVKWLYLAQFALLVCGGAMVLVLAVADVRARPGPASLLLFLWAAGTFVFAWVVNWTVSGRNFLPLAPAACILLIRRLESRQAPGCPDQIRRLLGPLGVSLAVGLLAAWGDWKLADTARTAALLVRERYAAGSSAIGFQGHWGFQYYMELLGGKALDEDHLDLAPNEIIVVPANNTSQFRLPDNRLETLGQYHLPAAQWLALMSVPAGAGYYSDRWGPAPFVFGPAPTEDYLVLRVKPGGLSRR